VHNGAIAEERGIHAASMCKLNDAINFYPPLTILDEAA